MSTPSDVAAEIVGPSASDVARTSFVRFWSSVKLAVVLILAIAIGSILGTIVPQGDPSGIQSIEGMSERTKNFLIAIKAYNVYYSSWYLGLLALFFLNLAVCTYVRVWPRLKYALRRPREIPVAARDHMPEQQRFPGVSVETLGQALRKAGYRTFSMSDGGLVADKNRIFRFAPMVVHLGLFLILIGGLVAGLMGYKHSFPLMPGETMAARQAIKEATTRGPLTPIPTDFKVRLDKFWMTQYPSGAIKQFYSTLSILEGDQVKLRKTIHVNEPLVYQGVYYYQSFWGVGAARLTIDRGIRSEISLPNQSGASVKPSGYITSRIELDGQELFAYTSGLPGSPWWMLRMADLKSAGELRPDRPLVVGKHELRLGKVVTNPGVAAITLRIAGQPRVVEVESARQFKMTGHISRQLKLGENTVFLYLPSPAELHIINLATFETMARLQQGAKGSVGVLPVEFASVTQSKDGGEPSAAEILVDGEARGVALVDLARTGFRVMGSASEPTELGGKQVYLLQQAEPLGSPLWIFDVHSANALGILNPGESVKIGHSRVRFDGPIHFSGLQTKTDPGIPVMYLGFFIVILGTIMGMWSHKQVWVTPMVGGCRLGGKANRGPFLFHRDMERLRERLVPPGAEFPPEPEPATPLPEVRAHAEQPLATT